MKEKTAAKQAERKNTLDDLQLFPWTPQRVWCSGLVGMIYPNLGPDGWDQLRRTKVYPGVVQDVGIFLYLSTLDPDALDAAERCPDRTRRSAREFAMGRGLHHRKSDAFWDGYEKFTETMNEVEAAATKPKGSTASEDEEFPKD